jgi:hypothetical protein
LVGGALALLPWLATPPVQAAGSWQPITYTCAGVVGVMSDGAWTHDGAAAAWAYPLGSIIEDDNGAYWTIEDHPALGWLDGAIHVDLYNGRYGPSCWQFGVQSGAARLRRWGWDGPWLD